MPRRDRLNDPTLLHTAPGALPKLFSAFAPRHHIHDAFRDFCEIAALSIVNRFERERFDAREGQYLRIAGKYNADELKHHARILSAVVDRLEAGHADVLGETFMSLDLGSHWVGQFFTPYPVARMMAMMMLGDATQIAEQHGYITLCEPASGAGAMVIACAHTLLDMGLNPQRQLHVQATDIDATAAHMCYIQLSLLGIPAVVIHGNTLSNEVFDTFCTPMHHLHAWDARLALRRMLAADRDAIVPTPSADTTPPITSGVVIVPGRAEQLALFDSTAPAA